MIVIVKIGWHYFHFTLNKHESKSLANKRKPRHALHKLFLFGYFNHFNFVVDVQHFEQINIE